MPRNFAFVLRLRTAYVRNIFLSRLLAVSLRYCQLEKVKTSMLSITKWQNIFLLEFRDYLIGGVGRFHFQVHLNIYFRKREQIFCDLCNALIAPLCSISSLSQSV